MRSPPRHDLGRSPISAPLCFTSEHGPRRVTRLRLPADDSTTAAHMLSHIIFIMDMRKVAIAALVAAATVSAAVAAVEVPAPAPGPSSGAAATFPVVASLVGASVLSFFALFH
ncbi:hypothetical protein VNO78_06358 [Psophocarpus tetragonolobus]|uniref:Uncharacterized protein n=1 Tax=Psophocarpus tetragonolobus TaxID=3891 RepID=A0AAN9XRR6_PSOTE